MNDHPRTLSSRERQVLTLVSFGLTNDQIGVGLGISALTVKTLLERVTTKLGTTGRAGMIGTAFRYRVLT